MKRIDGQKGILRRDCSSFPTDDESLEKIEKIGAYYGVEIGTIQDDGIVCDGEGIIHEDVSENFDGNVGEGVESDGADD